MVETPSRPPADSRPWPAGSVLLAGVGFGLVAGAMEAIAALVRERLLHETIYMGPDYPWLLPLADGSVYLVIAGLLVLASLAWRKLRSSRVVIALFAGLVVFSGLLLTDRIHRAASAILALGIGVAVARGLAARGDRVRRWIRWATPAGLVLAALLGLGMRELRAAAERRARAGLPAAVAGRPNILLLVLDTVRAWDLSLYGYGRPTTPRLVEWARRGALFQRALAPAPWTALSHGSFFTGRYPTELSVGWRTRYDGKYPTLAQALSEAGYATGGFAGNYLNVGRGTGLARGFTHYEDFPMRPIPILRTTSLLGRLSGIPRVAELIGRRRMVQGWVGDEVNRRFLRWLDDEELASAGPKRPWFAFLNYFDAHGPYLPPVPWDTVYMAHADPVTDRYWARMQSAYGQLPMALPILAVSKDAYDGAISYLDSVVDALLRALEERRQLDNTIVVVTSDHGELFGEHGILAHGNSLYLPVLHVPLLVIAPGRAPAGALVPSLASLRDLPATLLEMAGVANPGLPGHSLTGLWGSAPGSVVDTLFAALDYHRLMPKWPPTPILRGSMRAVVLDSLEYIVNGDGQEELYHLGGDAWQLRNLVSAPEYQPELARYRAAMKALPSRTTLER